MLRNIRLLYLHNFLSDFRPQWPFAVVYFAQISGSYTAAMSIWALEMLSSAFMDIPTGIFSDRVGRRYTIFLGSLSAAIGVALYALAQDIWGLLPGAFFMGLSQCLFNGNNNAMLYESLKSQNQEGRFHHYQGRTSSMWHLALCISAFLAAVLEPFGLKFIFMVGIFPQVLAAITSLFFKEPRIHIHDGKKNFHYLLEACIAIRKNPRLWLLLLAQTISFGAGESNYQFKTAFVNMLWPGWGPGIFRGINHSVAFLGYWFSGRILDRIKAPYYLAFREAYWFITQTIAVIMSNVFTPLLMLTGAFVYGPGEVAREQLLQKEFSDHQRATMASIGSFASSLAYAGIALAIGAVADHFGLTAGVSLGIAISVMALPFYIYLYRRHF